jgi:hypothetical protein
MAEMTVPGGVVVRRATASSAIASSAIVFGVASSVVIASDLTTPLAVTIPFVGAATLVALIVLVALTVRTVDKIHEARLAALVLPAALCAWAVFQWRETPPGQPPSGVLAQAFPALERLQAGLPVRADVGSALRLENTLKTGSPAAKALAVAGIAGQPTLPRQKYLYGTAVRFGDGDQRQLVAVALLRRLAGRPAYVQLRTEDNVTAFEQYLEGSSLLFEPSGPHRLRARLKTDKEGVAMRGALAGPVLTLAGTASLSGSSWPLTVEAGLGADLAFSGSFHFAKAADVPFTLQAF